MNAIRIIMTFVGWLLLISGILQLGASGALAWYSSAWIEKAESMRGRVIDIRGLDPQYPVIIYTDENDLELKLECSTGLPPGTYEVGDTVTVLYNPKKRTDARLDEWEVHWGLPWILMETGSVSAGAGLVLGVIIPLAMRLAGWTRKKPK